MQFQPEVWIFLVGINIQFLANWWLDSWSRVKFPWAGYQSDGAIGQLQVIRYKRFDRDVDISATRECSRQTIATLRRRMAFWRVNTLFSNTQCTQSAFRSLLFFASRANRHETVWIWLHGVFSTIKLWNGIGIIVASVFLTFYSLWTYEAWV